MIIKKIYFPLIYTYYLSIMQKMYAKENLKFILSHPETFSQDIIKKYKILTQNTTNTLKLMQKNIFQKYIQNELPNNISSYCWDIDLLNQQLIIRYQK